MNGIRVIVFSGRPPPPQGRHTTLGLFTRSQKLRLLPCASEVIHARRPLECDPSPLRNSHETKAEPSDVEENPSEARHCPGDSSERYRKWNSTPDTPLPSGRATGRSSEHLQGVSVGQERPPHSIYPGTFLFYVSLWHKSVHYLCNIEYWTRTSFIRSKWTLKTRFLIYLPLVFVFVLSRVPKSGIHHFIF